ncbi:MAG: hypothetical protein IKH73_02045, partial [Erysipelotrichaceae bacterium]|nr:hypothetical protein [Erysipelotrichaceae bacterium]
HHAEKVTFISHYTYGGFSGFVKNVLDRCLGYVLPQFEIVNNESHHQKRYDEDKPVTFIFYGHDLSEDDRKCAERYVTAVCANMRTHVEEVIFRECEEPASGRTVSDSAANGKTVILNASLRWSNGNSAMLARELTKRLNGECETVALPKYMNRMNELMTMLKDAETLILCMPLYVDGLPSQLIRFMQKCEAEYQGCKKKVYILANMGLYESSQLINLFSSVKKWCARMSFEYCGGLGASAGELLGALARSIPLAKGPGKNTAEGLDKLAEAINNHASVNDIFVEPFMFPRRLYILIANRNWNNLARKNGIRPKDLYRQL